MGSNTAINMEKGKLKRSLNCKNKNVGLFTENIFLNWPILFTGDVLWTRTKNGFYLSSQSTNPNRILLTEDFEIVLDCEKLVGELQ